MEIRIEDSYVGYGQHDNTRFDGSFSWLHVLSKPAISCETSDVLFSLMPLRPLSCRCTGDGFRGEENKPDISSRPFSSRRACGTVIPVRLRGSQRMHTSAQENMAHRPTFPTAEKSLLRSLRTCGRGAMIVAMVSLVDQTMSWKVPSSSNGSLPINSAVEDESSKKHRREQSGCQNVGVQAIAN